MSLLLTLGKCGKRLSRFQLAVFGIDEIIENNTVG